MEKDELENQGWLNTSRATEKPTSAWLAILESYLSGTSWLPAPVPSDYLLFLYFGGRALPMLESCKLFWALQASLASRVLGGPLCPSGGNVSHWKEQRHHRSIQHPYPVTNRKLSQTWEITIFRLRTPGRAGSFFLREGEGWRRVPLGPVLCLQVLPGLQCESSAISLRWRDRRQKFGSSSQPYVSIWKEGAVQAKGSKNLHRDFLEPSLETQRPMCEVNQTANMEQCEPIPRVHTGLETTVPILTGAIIESGFPHPRYAGSCPKRLPLEKRLIHLS